MSFVVWSPVEIPCPRIGVLIEPGTNVFNGAFTEGELIAFRAALEENKAKIVKEFLLDHAEVVIEPNPFEPRTLPTGVDPATFRRGRDDES